MVGAVEAPLKCVVTVFSICCYFVTAGKYGSVFTQETYRSTYIPNTIPEESYDAWDATDVPNSSFFVREDSVSEQHRMAVSLLANQYSPTTNTDVMSRFQKNCLWFASTDVAQLFGVHLDGIQLALSVQQFLLYLPIRNVRWISNGMMRHVEQLCKQTF